jgi:hypothetical protein
VQQLHIFTGQPHQGYPSRLRLCNLQKTTPSPLQPRPLPRMSPLAKVLVALVALASVAELAAGKNYTIQWAASGNSYGDWSAANPVHVGDTVGEVPVLSTYLSSMQLGTSLHRSSEIFTRFHWCSVHVRGAAHRRRAVAAGLRGLQLRQAAVAGRQRPHRHHVPHGWHQVLRVRRGITLQPGPEGGHNRRRWRWWCAEPASIVPAGGADGRSGWDCNEAGAGTGRRRDDSCCLLIVLAPERTVVLLVLI